jgi:hypothetical protein
VAQIILGDDIVFSRLAFHRGNPLLLNFTVKGRNRANWRGKAI